MHPYVVIQAHRVVSASIPDINDGQLHSLAAGHHNLGLHVLHHVQVIQIFLRIVGGHCLSKSWHRVRFDCLQRLQRILCRLRCNQSGQPSTPPT